MWGADFGSWSMELIWKCLIIKPNHFWFDIALHWTQVQTFFPPFSPISQQLTLSYLFRPKLECGTSVAHLLGTNLTAACEVLSNPTIPKRNISWFYHECRDKQPLFVGKRNTYHVCWIFMVIKKMFLGNWNKDNISNRVSKNCIFSELCSKSLGKWYPTKIL